MRRFVSAFRSLVSLGLVFCIMGLTSYGLLADPTQEIGTLMTTLFERGQFNGAVLVARKGKIIYRNAFGKANFQTGTDFTPETPNPAKSTDTAIPDTRCWRSWWKKSPVRGLEIS